MVVTQLDIVLDNGEAVFVAQDVISGIVVLETEGPVDVRKVVVFCRGVAVTDWKERSLATKQTKHYQAQHVYFELQQQVHDEGEIAVGKHTFKFEFTLPETDLPSSFEGTYGFVRYSIKVVLDRPWRLDNEAKVTFTYVSNVDLNSKVELLMPAFKEEEQFLCCCCCKSGPIRCTAKLPRTGYVCGELIPFEGQIENRTTSALNVRLELIERVIYLAEHEWTQKEETRILKSYGKKKVEANGYVEWNKASGLEIMVPPTAPSGLPPCNLIRLGHILQMTVEAGTFHLDMELPIQLCIGTVPFAQTFDTFATCSSVENQLQEIDLEEKIETVVPGAITYAAPTLISKQYSYLPLPEFQEGLAMENTIKEDNDTKEIHRNFTPRYPVYQLSA